MANRHVFALDLKNEPDLIRDYVDWHRPGRTPPEIVRSIRRAGILSLEIHRIADRLIMIMEVGDDFSAEAKAASDAADAHVQAWETLMWTFQKALPDTPVGQKWAAAEKIFDLADHPDAPF